MPATRRLSSSVLVPAVTATPAASNSPAATSRAAASATSQPYAESPRPRGRRFDGDAVVPVVHAEVEHVTVARDRLHAENVGREPGPVVRILGRDPKVAKRLDVHRPH